ncbi:hypothetical protein cce_0192 [Crocosphaera subtropica ATCC 51142]|uniref:Uncharacterized protein n=1 Tax=Crocosphaera subtropica (strain ATCC 51142 / BH68) TaxID=43989 RepID=B1X043_CROS5|nr:hypothetical protein [Crocosphaera subtropica]ACB49544.1 hypothetical protein cce_0192 [Crocosphaera subtropica ATCC 51142]
MEFWIFVVIALIISALGICIGGSMVVYKKRQLPTQKPQRTAPSSHLQKPSRKSLILPMGGLLGVSMFLLIIGYGTMNIVAAAVGFLLLFLAFGLVGSFIFNQIF